ncbi:MAG: hypothetical protein L3J96_05695 [Thermoplasmata archaeon]|nr:hypothetical protein [Thermoplasmata archaeon]
MGTDGRGRVVALEGPSAVGKTTVSRLLADRSDWTVLGEASVRLRPRPTLRFASPSGLFRIERRLLGEERRRCDTARQLSDRGLDVLLDTAPFGPATYSLAVARLDPAFGPTASRIAAQVVEEVRNGRLLVPHRVVYLSAPDSALRTRAEADRQRHPPRLAARHRAVGQIERKFWTSLAKASDGAVGFLSASGAPSGVASRLLTRLAKRGSALDERVVLGTLRDFERECLRARAGNR